MRFQPHQYQQFAIDKIKNDEAVALFLNMDSYEINAILRKIDGWERYTGNKQGKLRIPNYGIQRVFVTKRYQDSS